MKATLFLLLIWFGTISQAFCESIVCGFPSRLYGNHYVLTGSVIGFEEVSFEDRDENCIRTVAMNVKVIKSYHAKEKFKSVRLLLFSYSVEDVRVSYKLGTIISFYGTLGQAIPGDERNFIEIGVCNPILKGAVWIKRGYDFKKQRMIQSKIRTKIRLVQNDSLLGWDEKNMLVDALNDELVEWWRKNSAREKFEACVLLAKLTKVSSEEKKLKILKKLMWTTLIHREDYFKDLNISDSMKATLVSEWRPIHEEWSLM